MNAKTILIWIVIILIIIGGICALFIFDIGRKVPIDTSITNFETCVEAGNPIIETFPPQCETADGRMFASALATTSESVDQPTQSTSNASTTVATSTTITIAPNSYIQSPVVINGNAPGSWYFEAVFPIQITDAHGTIIGKGSAEAQADWMTTGEVPFKATIEFGKSLTPTGFIILMNDNPSGNASTSQKVTIPINITQ